MSRLNSLDFGSVVKTQNRLYERAFKQTDEQRLSTQVINYDAASDHGFGGDPAFPVFPAEVRARVDALPMEQQAKLTRLQFAMEKQNVAQNEMVTLTWNERCAIRAFGMFSDEYWVQHRETLDEHDHIYGFELLVRKVLGMGLSPAELERKNRFRDYTFQTLDPVLKDKHAIPSLYFTLRFVANVFLKMIEGFSFDPKRTDIEYSAPLLAINTAHHDDEARHFTSSWSFGRHLYTCIEDAQERELIRGLVTLYLGLHVQSLAMGGHGLRTGLETLLYAVETKALPALDLSKEQILVAYASHRSFVDLGPSRRRESFRWAASQLRKLETALELEPAHYALDWLSPENRALMGQIRAAILANGTAMEGVPFEAAYRVYRSMLGEA